MATVYLLHGFNVSDKGTASIDTIKPSLIGNGHKVIDLDYGHFHRLRVRLCNESIAKVISNVIEPDSVVIGHSNGCAIIHEAAKFGAPFSKAVLINPALDKDLPVSVPLVKVFYSPSDKATLLARFIPYSIWGSQGRYGYTGEQTGYSQVDMDSSYGLQLGHSGVFHDPIPRAKLEEDIERFIVYAV